MNEEENPKYFTIFNSLDLTNKLKVPERLIISYKSSNKKNWEKFVLILAF